jgi:hypothetical protein
MTFTERTADKWWKSIPFEHKFYIIIENKDLFNDDATTHPSSLTVDDITELWRRRK